MKEFNRKRLTDLESKLMVARGEETVRELGMVMYTLLYLKWITNKDLLHSPWNSAQCNVAAWLGVGFRREWIHVYVLLNHSALHLKLSQHC